MRLSKSILAGCLLMGAALAQDGDEIVVTAARYADSYDEVQVVIPYIALTRRADNLVTRVTVVCDTREIGPREEELKQTLRDMIRKAAESGGTIALSVGDEVLEPFDETLIDKSIGPGGRPDSSQAIVVVKTMISPEDKYDDAVARIQAFAVATPKTGRTEILQEGRLDLTLIGPEKYRPDLIGLIAADARATAAQFGGSFAVAVEGLEKPIAWRRSGPLELGLYIPYTLAVSGAVQP
jgi:hypothetical protein